MEPKIVFEDEYVIVIDKPAGMVANEAQSTEELTVQKWFTDKYSLLSTQKLGMETKGSNGEFFDKGGIVHRLDKDTSGLMVLAKTEDAYNHLKTQFIERKTVKKYLALVHEWFTDSFGEINKPVDRHPKDYKKFTITDNLSRMSITDWKVIEKYMMENGQLGIQGNKFSLMELVPHTGRTHQLRVHMQYMHHPIVSDIIYGFKKSKASDFSWCPRLFLHAFNLGFVHPKTLKFVEFKSELPEELSSTLLSLKRVD